MLASGLMALATSTVSALPPTLPAINTNNIINITNAPYNAVSGGVITNTAAIQSAINAAAAGGTTNGLAGGTVEIPPGVFLSGALALKSKVNLQVDAGATLKFLAESNYPNATGNPDYPIAATNLADLEISGSGTIDGNGAGWWSANPPNRPYMIFFTKCQRVLIQNVTLQNPPKMHIVFKNSAANVTIQGININTISTSPNTDGIDLIGTNCLIQNCFISAGDDNIAFGSSSSGAITSDVLVTNCTFGFGHGVSLGSNTQGGVSNLTVINCTFNGTQYGIRMKSDDNTSGGSGQGGVAENLFYYNIGMTNITRGPIVIYSYYSEFGTPIGITPAVAAAQTVDTNIYPIWRNIVISNLTATVTSSGQAGVIWGRIETPATNILMSHVNITAPATFDVYNAYGIQFADSQINVTGSTNKTLTLFNAGVTVSNNTGGPITVDGLTSDNSLALYSAQASLTANDAFGADPITLGGGTLTINNSLALPGGSAVNFVLGNGTSRVISTGALSLNSTLNIDSAPGFAPGTYTLFSYSGSLSGSPVLGTTPIGFPFTYSLDTSTPGQVNFIVSSPSPPSPPVFGHASINGGNLVFSGTGGTTNGNYYVLTSTNLALPLNLWPPLATNTFDGSGNFTFTDTNGLISPQRFYRLMLP